jgi:hypothetical protein
VPPRDSSHGGNRRHTSQRVRRTIGSLALQPNAAWNWGMFENGPLIRNIGGWRMPAGNTISLSDAL